MCQKPVQILNPHFSSFAYRDELGELKSIPQCLCSHQKYIEVPCGTCPECRSVYYNSILQRCIVEAQTSYMYFVTLTYDDKHLPYVDFHGERIFYFDYSHVQNMFKRFRDSHCLDRDFRYICVNEYGDRKYRAHAHLLIFVARHAGDSLVTPYQIEEILFKNLGKYFAVNVGTRKHPKYEKLFTYQIKYTSKGVRTNYFVKYVSAEKYNNIPTQSDEYVKTIRYLISYINKPNKYEEYLQSKIFDLRLYDPILFRKLSFLRSRVRFSKGLGFGFVDGKKHSLRPISVGCSYTVGYFNSLRKDLPKKYEEFELLYPDLAQSVIRFMWHNGMRFHDSLEDYLAHLEEVDQLKYYLIAFIYFPCTMSDLVRDFFFKRTSGSVSYFFDFLHPTKYALLRIHTDSPNHSSPVYKYIRRQLSDGLNKQIPFLPFAVGNIYMPLCKFYQRYCTTSEDLLNMYDSIGVSCYDEWRELFESRLSKYDKLSNISKYNSALHYLSENKICISQNFSLSLYNKPQRDIYTTIFAIG